MSDANQVLKKLSPEDLIFCPSPIQRRVKAKLWTKLEDNPIADSNNLSCAAVQQLVNDTRVSKWWSTPGFKEWLLNKDEYKERLNYLFDLALDASEDILTDPEANPNAKVNTIKVIAELADKVPTRWKNEKYADEDIQKMDRAQLEAYISKNKKLLEQLENGGEKQEKDDS